MKVLDAAEKYFKQLRLTAKDPRVSMAAAKWEIFFDDQIKVQKNLSINELIDVTSDIDHPLPKEAHK